MYVTSSDAAIAARAWNRKYGDPWPNTKQRNTKDRVRGRLWGIVQTPRSFDFVDIRKARSYGDLVGCVSQTNRVFVYERQGDLVTKRDVTRYIEAKEFDRAGL